MDDLIVQRGSWAFLEVGIYVHSSKVKHSFLFSFIIPNYSQYDRTKGRLLAFPWGRNIVQRTKILHHFLLSCPIIPNMIVPRRSRLGILFKGQTFSLDFFYYPQLFRPQYLILLNNIRQSREVIYWSTNNGRKIMLNTTAGWNFHYFFLHGVPKK